MGELDERSSMADAQKVEIVALKTQVDALKDRLDEAGNELKAVEDRRDAERVELKAATQELAEERGKVENLGRRVSELEQRWWRRPPKRKSSAAAPRIWKTGSASSRGCSPKANSNSSSCAARSKPRARPKAICAPPSPNSTAAPVRRPKRSRPRMPNCRPSSTAPRTSATALARDLGNMKRETEEIWASERVENALLRERINDVAAEVARLASALEGPNSPIDAILAAETARDRGSTAGGQSMATSSSPRSPSTGGNLADRIRALQTHASRVPHGDEPKPQLSRIAARNPSLEPGRGFA